MKENQWKGILILVITTLLWGSTFPVTKKLLSIAGTEEILFIRFFFTALILGLIRIKDLLKFRDILAKTGNSIYLLGIVNFLAIYFQTIGLETLSSANAGFITSFSVLLVPVFNHILKIYPFQKKIIISVLFALVGIYILSYGFQYPRKIHSGDLWIFLSAIAYAFYIILVEKVNKSAHPFDILFIVFGITAFLFLIINFNLIDSLLKDKVSSLITFPFIFYMTILVILGSVAAYGLMVYGQKFVSSNLAAMIYLLEPVFASLLAVMFFEEEIFLKTILGGIIILLALYFSVCMQDH